MKFQQCKTVNREFKKEEQYSKVAIFYNNPCTLISPIYLSLAGNIIVYTPDQGPNREKYFNHIIYQSEKMPTLAGYKHPSVHLLPHGLRLSHLSTGKGTVRSAGNGH